MKLMKVIQCETVRAVSSRPFTPEALVQYLVSSCGICGWQGFAPSSSIFPSISLYGDSMLMYHPGDEQ
jgi:hypothetical protein